MRCYFCKPVAMGMLETGVTLRLLLRAQEDGFSFSRGLQLGAPCRNVSDPPPPRLLFGPATLALLCLQVASLSSPKCCLSSLVSKVWGRAGVFDLSQPGGSGKFHLLCPRNCPHPSANRCLIS